MYETDKNIIGFTIEEKTYNKFVPKHGGYSTQIDLSV